MLRCLLKIFAGLTLMLVVAVATGWYLLDRYRSTPLNDESARVLIRPGSSWPTIVNTLSEAGVVDEPEKLRLYGRLADVRRIRAGEFDLPAGLTPDALIDVLSSAQSVQYPFTIIEGWNVRQLLAQLQRDTRLQQDIQASDPQSLARELSLDVDHAEGWFLPETYMFTRGDSVRSILERAHDALQETLQTQWQARQPDLPLKSPTEALILASIIEKETGLAEERPRIAGVFTKRLRIGMRLQTDPTVIYGIGPEFDGDIRRRDLTTDTPYNTYTRHGLPPTPIALAGEAAIHAALNPDVTGELYFVASGGGGHAFSRTLREHNAAVRKYQLGQ